MLIFLGRHFYKGKIQVPYYNVFQCSLYKGSNIMAKSSSEIYGYYEVFNRGTNLVSMSLLAGESLVGAAICGSGIYVLCACLDGLGMQLFVVISVRKWGAGFSEGYYKVRL